MTNDSKVADYKVADISLADFGRREIALAETEMPALMALRRKYSANKPLADARILGCIHMTIQTAVLIDTLVELGAEVRWSSCNIFSTQDHAAAAVAASGTAVYAWKGQTVEEGEWCIEQTILKDGTPWNANMILDDGGDLTAMVHEKYPQMLDSIHDITEETTTGVHRLLEMLETGELKVPCINVNDSITKSKNDNKYGCRHSLNDAIKRGTDMLMAGKKAACMDGFEVASPYIDGINTGTLDGIDTQLMGSLDLIVTTTGNTNVCDRHMLATIKQGAVVCNIGHFDNEIDTAFMRDNYDWSEVKPQVHRIQRDKNDEHNYILLLSEGRLVNLGNATGHPSRIMDGSFANQVLAQMYLYERKWADAKSEPLYVKVLPKKLDEEVAAEMVKGFSGVITKLTPEQADYINVKVEGPYKTDDYKY
jgi:adenosylhomocysteinase